MSDVKLQLTWENRGKYAKETITPIVLKPVKAKSLKPELNTGNMIIEGNNLDVMAALLTGGFALRGQVDLALWDPPYNTGNNDFRYSDDFYISKKEVEEMKARAPVKDDWDVVSATDPSRHTKWLNFMEVRLRKAQELLKPSGVIAVCIGYQELFRLGMLMDELFDEENRLGIINWQTSYSAKNDSSHISTATEYVLVYANNKNAAMTGLLERTAAMDTRYTSRDGDPNPWKGGDLSAKAHPKPEDYGIQSPFTGEIHYPPGTRRWGIRKSEIKRILELWGSTYTQMKDPNSTLPSLVLEGTKLRDGKLSTPATVLKEARKHALEVRDAGVWPEIYFASDGEGRPAVKVYLKDVKKGRIPLTYWADEDYASPFDMGSQSWEHTESGHSQAARNLLDAIVGTQHNFDTAKPIRLIEKILQLWCPSDGMVLDAFSGSGTTGHAVLALNNQVEESNRRFILIEGGSGRDRFCNTLTAERVRRVITGKWAAGKQPPLTGGFTYYESGGKITRKVIMESAHEQLADIILQSADDVGDRIDCRLENPSGYVIGKTRKGNAIALVWRNTQVLTNDIYYKILAEAKKLKMKAPVFIYARASDAVDDDGYQFCLIPDKILAALGIRNGNELEGGE
ncbi:MAG TPA: site-specific DNA-methyltransferase [Pyrinomonadaceae bacterium]|jgi:adenine-specific DNA-methyltransferase